MYKRGKILLNVHIEDGNRVIRTPDLGKTMRTPCQFSVPDKYKQDLLAMFRMKSIKKFVIEETDEVPTYTKPKKMKSSYGVGGSSIDMNLKVGGKRR